MRGAMSFSYTGKPGSTYHDAVRFHLGDVRERPKSASDEEIAYVLAGYGVKALDKPANAQLVLAAAADVADAMAARRADNVSVGIGGVSEALAQQGTSWAQVAKRLRARARASAMPWVGGRSQSEKVAAEDNADAVQPAFRRDHMTDNQTIA